jgi:SnoaL-like domain
MPITPADLCNIEEIKQLKASYFRYLDTKQWGKWRGIFTDDARFEGTAKLYDSVDEFITATSKRLQPAKTIHQGHMPEIRLLAPSRARGIWAMFDWVEFPEPDRGGPFAGERGFVGYGHYQEEYRQENGVWKIAFLRLTRIRLDPLFGKAPWYDLPPGRLWSRADDWLEHSQG